MYGYTMQVPAPAEAYQAMHKAVLEVIGEGGGGDGLILHLAHETEQGFDLTEVWESKDQLDAFNQTVFPKAWHGRGCRWKGRRPRPWSSTRSG